MNKDDLIKLALPIAIIVAALILYLGITEPYRECVAGSVATGRQLGGSTDDQFSRSLAQVQCGAHR